MFCINLPSNDPFFNLAVEEYLLRNSKEDYLIIGINTPSVIIGKHQVAHREADTRFVSENGIPVIRRITGGGTVYHDPGNLNFSFISQSTAGKQVDFRKYTLPVAEFLASEGIKADFEGRSDLKVNGLKISGNAEHVYHERVLHHGTLLFDTQLDDLKGSLRNDTSRYSTRAVESNPSSVMNLKDVMNNVEDIEVLKSRMLTYFIGQTENRSIELTPEEIMAIGSLAESKYRTWEWNFAYGPEYHFSNRFEINGINYSCRIFVRDGIIWESEVKGSDEMAVAAKNLIGCRHMPEDIHRVIKEENILISESDVYKFF
jgi:lipoate-protein ligase A